MIEMIVSDMREVVLDLAAVLVEMRGKDRRCMEVVSFHYMQVNM